MQFMAVLTIGRIYAGNLPLFRLSTVISAYCLGCFRVSPSWPLRRLTVALAPFPRATFSVTVLPMVKSPAFDSPIQPPRSTSFLRLGAWNSGEHASCF